MSHIEEEFLTIEQNNGWKVLFQKLDKDLQTRCAEKQIAVAQLPVNQCLNRFRDVLPYDETRVRLRRGPNDYINANHVEVPLAQRKYILTQGPLPTTIKHFWQMVWEQNSRVIVMLTRLIEKGTSKCCLYYPDCENTRELVFSDIDLKVTFDDEREYRHYTQRKFQLSNTSTGESHLIIHWSDFDWPDHGAPNNPEPFLHLLSDVRQSGAFDYHYGAPILHCSAGIGRSGTFVLVDSVLKMLAHSSNPRSISLLEVLGHIRTQRFGLIQTVEQLRFSYLAIIMGLKILDVIERSERPYTECTFEVSSDSEEDESNIIHRDQKVCRRQNNIMPNGRLHENLEDINCELIQRADSVISNYQLSPKSTHHLLSTTDFRFSSEDLKSTPNVTPRGSQTSLRFRSKPSSIDDPTEMHVEIPTMDQRITSPSDKQLTFVDYIQQNYRQRFFVGVLIFFAGSFFLYKCAFSPNRNV